jgi:hypothetical protein
MSEESRPEEVSSEQPMESRPKWLKRVQENSWEPEILISGLALAFIFAFPAQIYELATYLVQEKGVHFIGGILVFIYLSFVVNIYKIFFLLHLCLRFAWVGTVGLSYAFPRGVIKENLFKISQNQEFRNPNELVLSLERICSMAFGFPLMLSLIFLPITAYLMVLGTIYLWLDLPFIVVYGLFLFSLLIPVFTMLNGKKSKHKTGYTTSLVGSISAAYASNIGKWKTNFYFLGVFAISIPFVISDSKGILMYANAASLNIEEEEWTNESSFHFSNTENNRRFARAQFERSQVGKDQAALFVAYYKEDENHIRKLNEHHSVALDSLDFSLESDPDLYRVYLNDSLIVTPPWQKVLVNQSNQKAYKTYVPLNDLDTGFHTLRLEKVSLADFGLGSGKLRLRKKWAIARFYKE